MIKKNVTLIGLLLLTNTAVFCQINFAAGQSKPFGLNTASAMTQSPTLIDIDNDGDLDIFSGHTGGNIYFIENIGTSKIPNYTTPIINPFGIVTTPPDNTKPTFADIDNDGDFDLFVGLNSGTIVYYENTGSKSTPAFATGINNAFGFGQVSYDAAPTFVDIDNDGDLDAFSGQDDGKIKFFENTGSVSFPAFQYQWNDYAGLSKTSSDNSSPTFVDLDNDGDYDAYVGEYYTIVNFYENTGTKTIPVFESPVVNPHGWTGYNNDVIPAFGDIDGDGDLDLLAGSNIGIMYFENISVVTHAKSPNDNKALEVFPNPASNKLTIKSSLKNSKCTLINTLGIVVLEFELNNGQKTMDVSSFAKGLYFVQIKSDDNIQTKSLVIE